MNRRLLLGTTFSLGMMACAEIRPGDDYIIYLDPAFSVEEQSEIVEGLADWTTHVPVNLQVRLSTCTGFSNGVICTHRAATTADLPGGSPNDRLGVTYTTRGLEGTRGDTGGWYLDPLPHGGIDGGEVWIDMSAITEGVAVNTTTYSGLLSTVFNHEIGHGMGLIHHPVVALMNPAITTGSPTITCDDIAQWYYVRYQSAPACRLPQ